MKEIPRHYLSRESSLMLIEESKRRINERRALKALRETLEAENKTRAQAKKDADERAMQDAFLALTKRIEK